MPHEEKTVLMFNCTNMVCALVSGDAQEVARAMAMLKAAMTEFMETGYISYESVDTELCKFLEEMKEAEEKEGEVE